MGGGSPLGPYLAQQIQFAGSMVPVSSLKFVEFEDRWSTAAAPLLAGELPANLNERLFQKSYGSTGQGWTTNMTVTEASDQSEPSRMAQNEAYLAFAIGFRLYATSGVGSLSPVEIRRAGDYNLLLNTIHWSLQLAGGIERNIGKIAQYPYSSGVWGIGVADSSTSGTNQLRTPALQNGAPGVPLRRGFIPFSPLVETVIRARCGTGSGAAFASTAAGQAAQFTGTEAIAIQMYLRGVRVTA